MGIARRILEHPLTRGLPVDDPRTTHLRKEIIRSKPFLRALYVEWYRCLLEIFTPRGTILEVGSGAGFLQDLLPGLLTSEVFETPGVQLVADACVLPLADRSLDGIAMTDVFHHIPDVGAFLSEAARCLKQGGRLAMIEPWKTAWSALVYTHLHPEPFIPDGDWSIPQTGPLSGANGALPWIVFGRDRTAFEKRFPQLRIACIRPMMPFSYLLSGGVSMRTLLPGFMYPVARAVERAVVEPDMSMFALIVLERAIE